MDWYPWGEEAFRKAKDENRPVFLSIGYSTCHWCHVMERESFMDEGVADYLRNHFVSIKVDREERPDVDQIYMSACMAMTGSGGWPLTVFLTPEGDPFFAGTYFPREDRFGRPGFKTLLSRIVEVWGESKSELLENAARLKARIAEHSQADAGELKPELLAAGVRSFRDSFDETHGGFEGRNKFPRSIVHEFLLRAHRRSGDATTLEMVEKTLRAMRRGGMYDQLGLGFHRYSTDERWLVPHFEKMLYDQALLIRAYTQAYQATGCEEYAATARETAEYVLRDLTSPEGAFYSAEDADSDLPDGKGHAEGAFYVWTPEQIQAVLPGRDGEIVAEALGVVKGGNFESFEEHEPKGNSVAHVAVEIEALAGQRRLPVEEVRAILERGRKKLFEARAQRPRPHLDDKVLTDWNALMIGALAFCGATLEEPRYVAAAEKAAAFLTRHLRRSDGRWLHRHSRGESGIDAFLDDYAFLAEGFFLLHQASQSEGHLSVAVRTAELMISEFGDPDGGFFHTPASGEKLILRLKESYDGALPSGNSVAALALLRLADLCGREDFRAAAEKTLRSFGGTIARQPSAYPYHLCALDALLGPAQEVVIVGKPDAPQTREMVRAVRRLYAPNLVLVVVPPDGGTDSLRSLVPMLVGRTAVENATTAYVCENTACQAPTRSVGEMVRQIRGK